MPLDIACVVCGSPAGKPCVDSLVEDPQSFEDYAGGKPVPGAFHAARAMGMTTRGVIMAYRSEEEVAYAWGVTPNPSESEN